MQIVKEPKKPKQTIDSLLNTWITIEPKLKKWINMKVQQIKRRKDLEKAILEAEKKSNLHDPDEQRKLITQFNLIQEGKSNLGRKTKAEVEGKISYMIRKGIIKVEI